MDAHTPPPPSLELVSLTKQYGPDAVAVDAIDLKVAPGSYCCLLGPSGCGKSSTLRMVAGHESVSSGDILLGGRNITDLPAASSRFLPSDHVHEIVPAAIPARGLTVLLRWVLARDAQGAPVLWEQHTSGVPLAPPALRLPFDVITPGP